MDKDIEQEFKVQLEEKRAAILAEANKTLSEMSSNNDNIPDPNDRATMESDRGFELRIRDRERKLLAKVDEAIQRIDEGEYGLCEECGDEIGLERLAARPVTTLCIDCKTAQENREKSQGK